MGRRPELHLDSQQIKQLYLTDKFTCQDLADRFSCSAPAIRNYLVAAGVTLRRKGKWKFKYPKYPFSRILEEEAYLVGFRIGDLHVHKENRDSRVIIVRCHTTQVVQIKLFESLFKMYSEVVIKQQKDDTWQAACYLDLSFDFLMDKSKVPIKYSKNKKAAWAFIAGYTDAEGNIIINQGRARFKIDSYDLFVLRWIHIFLLKQGINSRLRKIGKKGEPINSKSKIVWNADLWRLNVNSAKSLEIVLQSLDPYLRHETRRKHASVAMENIQKRKEKHGRN